MKSIFAFKQDKSVDMSMPEDKIVHGVEIKKVPIGQYVTAMKKMEDLPAAIMNDCFPGKNLGEIIKTFQQADAGTIVMLAGRLLVTLPEHIVRAACDILNLDYDDVMNNKTPKELVDIIKAYWELNDMSDFFKVVWGAIKKKLPTQISGSNAS